MGLSSRLLGADEHVVMHMRTHAKVLFWPAVGLVVAAGLLGAGAALVPSDFRPWGQFVVGVLAVVLVCWWSVIPYLRWRSSTYTVTNRRLITRHGILNKTGRDLALARINDVAYDRSFGDRLLGCGTLWISTAADGEGIRLPDVPDVEHVHVTMTELLFGHEAVRR